MNFKFMSKKGRGNTFKQRLDYLLDGSVSYRTNKRKNYTIYDLDLDMKECTLRHVNNPLFEKLSELEINEFSNLFGANHERDQKPVENPIFLYNNSVAFRSLYISLDNLRSLGRLEGVLRSARERLSQVYGGIEIEYNYDRINQESGFSLVKKSIFGLKSEIMGLSLTPVRVKQDPKSILKYSFINFNVNRKFIKHHNEIIKTFSDLWECMILPEKSELIDLVNKVNENEMQNAQNNPGNGLKTKNYSQESESHTLEDRMSMLGLVEYPKTTSMDSVGGYQKIKERLEKQLFIPFSNSNILDEIIAASGGLNLPHPKAMLFYGPPGTGKSLMARASASKSGINFLYLNAMELYTKWFSESAKRMKEALDTVSEYTLKHGKTILFIDELDSIGKRIDPSSSTDTEDNRVVNVLLTKLSGLDTSENDKNLALIGATNFYDKKTLEPLIDVALKSRMGEKIFFPPPSFIDLKAIWKVYEPRLSDDDTSMLARESDGFCGRDVEITINNARNNFLADIVEKKSQERKITIDYYFRAISELKSNPGQIKQQGEKENLKNLYS